MKEGARKQTEMSMLSANDSGDFDGSNAEVQLLGVESCFYSYFL